MVKTLLFLFGWLYTINSLKIDCTRIQETLVKSVLNVNYGDTCYNSTGETHILLFELNMFNNEDSPHTDPVLLVAYYNNQTRYIDYGRLNDRECGNNYIHGVISPNCSATVLNKQVCYGVPYNGSLVGTLTLQYQNQTCYVAVNNPDELNRQRWLKFGVFVGVIFCLVAIPFIEIKPTPKYLV